MDVDDPLSNGQDGDGDQHRPPERSVELQSDACLERSRAWLRPERAGAVSADPVIRLGPSPWSPTTIGLRPGEADGGTWPGGGEKKRRAIRPAVSLSAFGLEGLVSGVRSRAR